MTDYTLTATFLAEMRDEFTASTERWVLVREWLLSHDITSEDICDEITDAAERAAIAAA